MGFLRGDYLRLYGSYAKSLAVCFAIVALASCGEKSDNSMFQTGEDAANTCRAYLSEVRKIGSLSTKHLIEAVNDWQTLRDSVFIFIAEDTINRLHNNHEAIIHDLHDSLRAEFVRLARSEPRTFTDVLLVKEQISRHRKDSELMQSVAETEPFFKSLDSIPLYKGNANGIVESYRLFLSNTLKSGINSKEELLAYIKEEDSLFRSFLTHLPELAIADLSAITHDTEKCCLSVFQSAEDGRLSYQDALIYVAKRSGRRIVQNALVCRNDIVHGRVKTEAQAKAYAWMLLQPYVALDDFGMSVLSDAERTAIHEIAAKTSIMMSELNKIIDTDDDQWLMLPGLLVEMTLASI